MLEYALAVSGGIGAGKTKLAERLAAHLDADHVSFGAAVKQYAREHDQDPNNRAVLQQLGQAMVLSGRDEFVKTVLAQRPSVESGRRKARLIVDGVRHIEVFLELQKQLEAEAGNVHLVHISTPGLTRQERVMERDNVERRVAARYDNDITEAQVQRILPQYAALIVNGELPVELQMSQVSQKLSDWNSPSRQMKPAA